MNKLEDLKNSLKEAQNRAGELKNSNDIEAIKNCIKEIQNLKDEIAREENLREPEEVNNLNGTENECFNNEKNNFGEVLMLENESGEVIEAVAEGMSFQNVTKSENSNGLRIGKYIKGMVTGDWKNASDEREAFTALSTTTGTTLIPTSLSAQIIDLARNRMALSGIPIIPMESNNLTIAKIVSDPVFGFKEELEVAEESEMSFAPITLKSKTIYGLMKISLELLNSASNIEQIVTQAMAESVAQAIDKAGLYGKGDKEPLGIIRVEGINKIESVEAVETSKYIPFVRGIGSITKANGEPNTISYNSDIDTELNLLTDTTGQPLNAPEVVKKLDKKLSNNIKDKQALIFDKNSIVMGLQNRIAIDTSKSLGFKDGSVYLRIYAMLDFAVLKPKNITVINYNGYIDDSMLLNIQEEQPNKRNKESKKKKKMNS